MNNAYTFDGLMNIAGNLVGVLTNVAWLAATAVIVWYGVKMILARGDETKFAEAKKGLTWAIVGSLVMFGVWTIILTLRAFVDSISR